LHGTGIKALEARELALLQTELEEGLRRVRDAELRRAAEKRVASQTNSFLCPIGCELMREPVMAADGHTYERVQIEEWIQRKGDSVKSPKTNERLAHTCTHHADSQLRAQSEHRRDHRKRHARAT